MESLPFVFQSEECVICLDNNATEVFEPCNHSCACRDCSREIMAKKMDCPLCRAKINQSMSMDNFIYSSKFVEVEKKELDEFKIRRDDYISELRRPCAKNAGMTGNSKLARGVSREMGSEMEEREKERKGTDRVTATKVEFVVLDQSNGKILQATYKVGRKGIVEEYPFMEWPLAKSTFTETISGDTITTLDMATHYPEFYWLWRHHIKNVEDALVECGLIQNKRQRTKR